MIPMGTSVGENPLIPHPEESNHADHILRFKVREILVIWGVGFGKLIEFKVVIFSCFVW